jgi:hypothetical protein
LLAIFAKTIDIFSSECYYRHTDGNIHQAFNKPHWTRLTEGRGSMLNMHDLYVLQSLARLERARRRHNHARALSTDRGRPSLGTWAARLAGRALVALGARLLAYSGERPLGGAELVPYSPPPTYSQN